jgi:hypothetical protein
VGVAGRQRHHDQVGAARQRPLCPSQVGHQHRGEEAWQGLGEGQHFFGVGQLRQQAGRHEGADLDLALAGRMGLAQPVELVRGRQHHGDALQAIAQPHLAHHGLARNKRVADRRVGVRGGCVHGVVSCCSRF